jgi:hypothetical protein
MRSQEVGLPIAALFKPSTLKPEAFCAAGDEDTSTPTAVAESRLKSVPEGAGEAAEGAAPEAAAAADDGQQAAAGAQDFPEAAQRGPSRQPSRRSLDWKRQESMLIGSVSALCLLQESCSVRSRRQPNSEEQFATHMQQPTTPRQQCPERCAVHLRCCSVYTHRCSVITSHRADGAHNAEDYSSWGLVQVHLISCSVVASRP